MGRRLRRCTEAEGESQRHLIQKHKLDAPAQFPAAYKLYHSTCQPPTTAPVRELLGTALLIAPQSSDLAKSGRYWIACLFTSTHYGAKKDKPTAILESTRRALDSLKKQVEATDSELDLANKLWAVRINAKAFRTPWGRTRRILAESGLDIKIMNNLTIMSKAERQKTVQEMEEMGFDPEAAPPFTK